MAYWWADDAAERFWVEIRKRAGIGTELWAPTRDEDGGADGWYNLVGSVVKGEMVYHWNANESRFVGRSESAGAAYLEEREGREAFVVDLVNFTPLEADLSLVYLRSHADQLYALRDELRAAHAGPLYLPWQFKEDRSKFASMSNYFAKLPSRAASILFGADGLGADEVAEVAAQDVPTDRPALPEAPQDNQGWAFLDPFKAKADTNYKSAIVGRTTEKSRTHETLVNSCAQWIAGKGLTPGRNAAIDLGVADLALIIEAKTLQKSWSKAIREAVGQLYEYRYFKVADPNSSLVFLADRPVPDVWIKYLEQDRQIGVMWPDSDGFSLSDLARIAFRL